jgi:hypothetical protein
MHQTGPVSVLVAPLDWGLGHATRCIPIINELTRQGARVIIAANGNQKQLLKQEFPDLETLEIPGYNIRYKSGIFLKWALLLKIPTLLRQIKRENRWLAETVRNYKIDGLISDNRYGLYYKGLYCVFITHQVYIQSGSGAGKWSDRPGIIGRWVDKQILKWNYKFISKFSGCWIPDQPGSNSIAGALTHPPEIPLPPPTPFQYIGILSRFHFSEKKQKKNSLLILISGPEPQRTRFEKKVLSQLPGIPMNTVLVRGLPGPDDSVPFRHDRLKVYNHLDTASLNELLLESEYIVARCGYSTIMDLVNLKRSAILVPTSGQTEQEYLARFLEHHNWMYCISEKKFDLDIAMKSVQNCKRILPELPDSTLRDVIREFLKNSVYSGL